MTKKRNPAAKKTPASGKGKGKRKMATDTVRPEDHGEDDDEESPIKKMKDEDGTPVKRESNVKKEDPENKEAKYAHPDPASFVAACC